MMTVTISSQLRINSSMHIFIRGVKFLHIICSVDNGKLPIYSKKTELNIYIFSKSLFLNVRTLFHISLVGTFPNSIREYVTEMINTITQVVNFSDFPLSINLSILNEKKKFIRISIMDFILKSTKRCIDRSFVI